VDPDGQLPFLIPLAIFIAKEIVSEGVEQVTGLPMPTAKNGLKYTIKQANKQIAKEGMKQAAKIVKATSKSVGKVSPSTLHERGTKIPGGRKIEDTLTSSNKIKNSKGEAFKHVDFTPSKPHTGLSPHTHPNFRNTLPDGRVRSGVSGNGQAVIRKDITDAARVGGQRTGGL
jgi:hypothetical protein